MEVHVNDDKREPLKKAAKSPKISSDDEFIKLPARQSRQSRKSGDAGKDGSETKCFRKSRRLQEKCAVEGKDKQVETQEQTAVMEADRPVEASVSGVETCDGNKGCDTVEVDAENVDCVKQVNPAQDNNRNVQGMLSQVKPLNCYIWKTR